jgi:hypothetical protein
MAITTNAELNTAVANWLARSDLTARIPEFIVMAESKFNRTLRHRQMITTTTLTTVAGTATVALPSDYAEVRTVTLQSSPDRVLTYVTPQRGASLSRDGVSEKPYNYSIQGSNIIFFKTPDAAYSVTFEYYQQIPDIATNSTNWLLTAASDLYVAQTLVEAYTYIRKPENALLWEAKADKILSQLDNESERSEWGGGAVEAYADVQVV